MYFSVSLILYLFPTLMMVGGRLFYKYKPQRPQGIEYNSYNEFKGRVDFWFPIYANVNLTEHYSDLQITSLI